VLAHAATGSSSGVTIDFDGLFALVKFGNAPGVYAGFTAHGCTFIMAGSNDANRRVLNMANATQGNHSFASSGDIFDGFGSAAALAINPEGCLGSGDIMAALSDYSASVAVVAPILGIVSPSDPRLQVYFGISRVGAFGKNVQIFDGDDYAHALVPVSPTANLPAAGSSHNGKLFIEDAGAGVLNLVGYGAGARGRIALVSF
jgi:hypothetical protein